MVKKTLRILFLVLFAAGVAHAQQNIATHLASYEKRGDRMFYYFSYQAALDDYLIALENEPEKEEIKLKIAECYRLLNNPLEAEHWYDQVILNAAIVKPEHKLHYAQALSGNGKYTEAKKWYERYKLDVVSDSRSQREIETIDNIASLLKDSISFEVDPLIINSPASDFSPTFYENGIVFVSAREQRNAVNNIFSWNKSPFLDLYFSLESENGTNTPPRLFHENVNSRLHEGPTIFFDEGRKMIFTRNNLLNGRQVESKDKIVKLKLYYSEKQGDEWSKPKPLSFNNNEYSVGHPAISSDGKILYFASDMPGGKGGTDIYKSIWQSGDWSKPVNLGNEINTEGNEMFPFSFNDNELYFASNGHGGLGGLDIFKMDLKDEKISNLGYPINTKADDFGLILFDDGFSGYFTSNRKGSAGDDDIYHFQIKREILNIIIIDQLTQEVIPGALVEISETKTATQNSTSNEEGSVTFAVSPKKNYTVRINKQGYFPTEAQVDQTDLQLTTNELTLKIPIDRSEGEIINDTLYHIVQKKLSEEPHGSIVEYVKTPAISGVMEENKISSLPLIKLFQINNISGIAQQIVLLNNITYFVATDGRSIYDYKEKELARWENPLPTSSRSRLDELWEYFSKQGYEVKIIEINNIYYDYNKSLIRNDASTNLDLIVHLLEENPELKVSLASHTDSRGSDGYNNVLAARRALAAKQYLIDEGIAANRVIQKGYGEKQLVNDCLNNTDCDENAHQLNRRTEFKLLFRNKN